MRKSTKLLLITLVSILAFALLRLAKKVSSTEPLQQTQTITGWVTDGVLPIVGAKVRIQGDTAFVTTDEKGHFTLPVGTYPSDQVPVTAGKEGWFNAGLFAPKGATNVILTLEHIPLKDDPSYPFVSPKPSPMGQMMGRDDMIGRMMERMPGMMGRGMMGMMGMKGMNNCGNCHRNIYEQWKSSSMAQTSRNPRVLDFYNGTDAKGKKGVEPGYRLNFPESPGPCADCHAPSAAIRNPGRTDLNKVLKRGGVDAQGIHCDFCHKIQRVEVNNRPGVNGAIHLNRQRIRGSMMMQPIFAFGPYDDVVTMPMAASYSSLYEKSEYCSSCHQSAWPLTEGKTWDYTRVYPGAEKYELYEKGKVVPDYWTYQEWLEWQDSLAPDDPDKGRKCQDCHMNWTQETLPYDRYIVTGMPRRMMGVEREPSTIHPHHFEGATEKRLQGATYMRLDAYYEGDEVVVEVEITNVNTGHWLPTGFSMRNMILVVLAVDSAGRRLQQTGGSKIPEWGGLGDPDEGNYAGLPGKGYAKVTKDSQGNQNVPIWQAVRIASDNRIKPKETDVTTYRFKKPKGEVTIEAKLIYRPVFKRVADQKKWALKDVVMEEKTLTL